MEDRYPDTRRPKAPARGDTLVAALGVEGVLKAMPKEHRRAFESSPIALEKRMAEQPFIRAGNDLSEFNSNPRRFLKKHSERGLGSDVSAARDILKHEVEESRAQKEEAEDTYKEALTGYVESHGLVSDIATRSGPFASGGGRRATAAASQSPGRGDDTRHQQQWSLGKSSGAQYNPPSKKAARGR
ncbi:hypothetical protein [Streptomyces sp. NPDC050560]|uniref:hypothetical protein n=1 Tax=Streptomyces sp. NPDC050560 TaxID=3365630 RepID=UPI0037936900